MSQLEAIRESFTHDRFATEAAPETVSETVTEETTLPNAA